ncbi:MAG: hypothetical protein HQK56_03555 [Deltaproteobacteria bacterium]|nr:hypothetical protein [Deltaproteobacteria bacterium]
MADQTKKKAKAAVLPKAPARAAKTNPAPQDVTPVSETPQISPPPQAAAPAQETPKTKLKPLATAPIKETPTAQPAPQTVAPAKETAPVSVSPTPKPEPKKDVPAAVPKAPQKAAKDSLPPEELVSHLLKTLKQHTTKAGLTCGDLGVKCGAGLKQKLALAKKTGDVAEEAGVAEAVASVIYSLWEQGRVFLQPHISKIGLSAPRIWSIENARNAFPKLFETSPPIPVALKAAPTLSELLTEEAAIKRAYDKYAPEYMGYVPIFKVRRELGWSREKFDNALRQLKERDVPLVNLMSGDPERYTPDETADSIKQGYTIYLQMRWRDE